MARHAVVVGEGVAACATVLTLERTGFDVTRMRSVPESDRSTILGPPDDLWIALWKNGVSCLRALGITDFPDSNTPKFERAQFREHRGADVATVSLDPGAFFVQRRVLRQRIEKELRAHPPESELWTACDQPNSVHIHDMSGGVKSCDLLIGADGIRGRTRQMLHGNAGIRSANQQVVCGFTSLNEPSLRAAVDRFIPGGLALSTADDASLFVGLRVADDRLYWYCAGLASLGTWDSVPELTAVLARRFRSFHEPIPTILEHGTPSPQGLFVEDLRPGTRFTRGRIALVGDAAHAMTPDLGQGCNQSLEDAVSLGKALGRKTSVLSALRDFAHEREPRAGLITEVSYLLSQATLPGSSLGAVARDGLMWLGRPFHVASMRWILDGGPAQAAG
ncbi:MAG: NAD(P)/FAD-dependent oxidoreductase [Myxococcota bacterium]